MDDLKRVNGPASPLEGRSAKVIAVILVGILVAIIKPWGTTVPMPVAQATAPVPSPSPTAASQAPFDPLALYDHEVFGIHEPAPRWELWPAGYLMTFGFAMRIDSAIPGSAPASTAPSAGAPPSKAPRPSTRPGPGEPAWPASINLTAGSHLSLIGINTPLGFTVSAVRLARLDAAGVATPVAVVKLRSRWPSHFTVVGMDDGGGLEARASWPPGRYRLDLEIEPGPILRTVEIVLDGPSTDDPGASTDPSPVVHP
jgi:hypothetical protein